MNRSSHQGPPAGSGPVSDLADILLDCLNDLARAGEVDAACRLAGRAYVTLRHLDPQSARRFDVFLHRQIRHLNW